MIKLFSKKRKNLVEEKPSLARATNYLKYTFGEIVLVVIGILIALSINNWNEDRQAYNLAKANYLNLVTSLQQDSTKVQRTIKLNKQGLEALNKIIPIKKTKNF